MRPQITALALLAVVAAALLPTAALAQSVSCTTFFPNGPIPMTDCSTPNGPVNCVTYFPDGPIPMTNCDGSGLSAPVQAAPPVVVPQVSQPASTDRGMYYRNDSGAAVYLPGGTFVKASGGPAIYVVAYQAVHAFGTWDQYLRWGGKPDLSNVTLFGTIDPAAIGKPVPLNL